jgi:amino acid permease
MATLIIACISWTLTALALWLLARALQRLKNRRTT